MRKAAIWFLILIPLQLTAQIKPGKIKVGVLSGYAFFKQGDLNEINQNVISQLPFVVRTIDDFKPYLYYGAYFQFELIRHFYVGPDYEYHYNGSRVGTKDYSGLFSFDQYVHTHQVGLKIDYLFASLPRTVFNIEMNAGANITDWRVVSNLEIKGIGGYSELEHSEFKGLSWHLSPTLKLEYRIISHVYLLGAFAYSFDVMKKYHYTRYKDFEVVKTPDWSGLKLSLGFEFNFF